MDDNWLYTLFSGLGVLTSGVGSTAYIKWIYRKVGIPFPEKYDKPIGITGDRKIDLRIADQLEAIATKLDKTATRLIEQSLTL